MPVGWRAAFAGLRLPADARVLVVPLPYGYRTEALRWQAGTGEPGSLIGGYFLGPDQARRTRVSPGPAAAAAAYLDRIWAGRSPVLRLSPAQVRADLAYWRPAAVVAVTRPGSALDRILAGLLGQPGLRVGRLLVWRR